MTDTLVDQILAGADDPPLFDTGGSTPTPGKKRGRPAGQKKDTPPRSHKLGGAAANTVRARRAKKLTELLESIGGAVSFIEQADGAVILEHAPSVAEAWARLADERPAVAKIIDNLSEGSAWFAVITAMGAMALPILMHHGLIPTPTITPEMAEAFAAMQAQQAQAAGQWAPPQPPAA